jgi:hypothetical protein
MISFNRFGSRVKITIESGVLGNSFLFEHNCGEEHFASLMSTAYNEHMNRKIRAIREQEYNKGWKDAKAKAKKQTWFSGWW